MGFSDSLSMRRGLEAVRSLQAPTAGTITLDSYTRTGDFASARSAVEAGKTLNGYPIVTHGREENRQLIAGFQGEDFPIQVRHGSPLPNVIFESLIEAGIDATEGGPISYCLPYSRVPLKQAIASWAESCHILVRLEEEGTLPHLESFGGCMLGQLCPPAMLLAITVIEGLFFVQEGIRSLSLSYAQGYSTSQDLGALFALRRLAAEFLGDAHWHVVVYCFMGKFPETRGGARRLIEESARIAVRGGAERLIVKTAAESRQIPTIEDNVDAIRWSHQAAAETSRGGIGEAESFHAEVLYAQAKALIEHVLSLDPALARGIEIAFSHGHLDVPYCLHPDNLNQARSWIDEQGTILWADPGKIPFPPHLKDTIFRHRAVVRSADLGKMLSFNQEKYDGPNEGCAADWPASVAT
jgi:methylaspartate mutase epsilon subunit